MHPVLAKFLSFEAARSTLERRRAGEPLDAAERCFVRASEAAPDRAARLAAEPHPKRPSEPAQKDLLVLAADAALRSLEEEPSVGPALLTTQKALAASGSGSGDARERLCALVSEEAFAYDDEALSFDRDFFLESLASLTSLAALPPEAVAAVESSFIQQSVDRRAATSAVEALLRPAGSGGPELITPEHLRAALSALPSPTGRAALAALLQHLERAGLLGAHRCRRLLSLMPQQG